MSRVFPFIAALILLPSLVWGNLEILEDSLSAEPEIMALEALRIREILPRLDSLGASYVRQELPIISRIEMEDYENSILVTIPGSDDHREPLPQAFILAVPLSLAGESRADLPFGIEAALELVGLLLETSPRRPTIVAFLRSRSLEAALEDLYSRLEDPEDSAFLYLEAVSPGGFLIRNNASGRKTPLAMLRFLTQIWNSRGVPYSFETNSWELYKFNRIMGNSPLRFTLNRDLPAIMIQSSSKDMIGEETSPRKFAESLAEYLNLLEWREGALETNYALLNYRGRTFFISERGGMILTLAILGFAAGSLLFYTAFRPHLPIPGWVDTFGAIAVIFGMAGVFFGVFTDLGYLPVFLWVLFFTTLGSVVPLPLGVFASAVLTSVGCAGALLIALYDTSPWEILRRARYLMFLWPLLPPTFLVVRGLLLTRARRRRRRRKLRDSTALPTQEALER